LDMPRPYMNKEEIQYMYNNFVHLFRKRERELKGETISATIAA